MLAWAAVAGDRMVMGYQAAPRTTSMPGVRPDPVRLFLVEDDAEVRENLSYLLRAWPGLEMAGAFPGAGPALRAIEGGLVAHVGLVDLGLPDMPGQELIRRLKQARPELNVIVLTIFDDHQNLFAALSAGATGYLLKDTPPPELAAGIFEVVDGGAPMSPSIARQVVAALSNRPAPPPSPLTPRETEVLELLVKGATYAMIGEALGVATSTVQAHIKAIYRKLECSTKAEAAAEAYKRGIIG